MRKTFMRRKEFFTVVNSHKLTSIYFLVMEDNFLTGRDVEDITEEIHGTTAPNIHMLMKAGFLKKKRIGNHRGYTYSTDPIPDLLIYAHLTEIMGIQMPQRLNKWTDALYSFRKIETELEKLKGNKFLKDFIITTITYDAVTKYPASTIIHQYCLSCRKRFHFKRSKICPDCGKRALIYITPTLLEWAKTFLNHLSIIYGSKPLMKRLSAAEREGMEQLLEVFDFKERNPVFMAKEMLNSYFEKKEQLEE
ncbi:MAG: hypothetical protein ABIB71_08345 [Candidatus Woesearchaeota archaeon]